MIPGRILHRLAARICSEKALDHVVEPAIADLQKEWAGSCASDSDVSSRVWTLLTGYCAVLKVIAICALSVHPVSEDEWRALLRALAWSVAMVIVFAVLLTLPPLLRHYQAAGMYGAILILPQAVPIAIPIGTAFGLAFGLSPRLTLNLAKAMLLGALVASALSFVILAWAVPAANTHFQEFTFRELRSKGYQGPPLTEYQKAPSEMTLSELRRAFAHFSGDGEPRVARQFAFALYHRFSLAAATLALVMVLLAAPAKHRGLRGVLAVAVCLVYWILMYVGDVGNRRGYLTVPVGAWLPNLALITSAILIASSRLRGSFRPSQ